MEYPEADTLYSLTGVRAAMNIDIEPIGYVSTDAESVPRFYTISDVRGALVLDERFEQGLSDFRPGDLIIVVFLFHRSPPFGHEHMRVIPPSREAERGVFSTRSPVRPNPIGVSQVEVIEVEGSRIHVKGLDMIDGTPILDIKPVK